MRRKSLWALLVIAVVASGCGGGRDQASAPAPTTTSRFDRPFTDVEAYPAVVSSDVAVGDARILIAMFDRHDAPTGTPATKMRVAFYDLARSETSPVFRTKARFLWAIKGVRGLWEVPDARLTHAGKWGVAVTVHGGGLDESDLRTSFVVKAEATAPDVGDPAPASRTPTARDVARLSEITSDPHPDPRFYKTSIAEALARHEPFVVVFATPKYCTSEVCGPTLDVVKKVAPGFPNITFIHVEVYDLSHISDLQPVPAMSQWRLPGEPWVFVVDSHGRVAARYEGTLSPRELRATLEGLK